MQIPSSSETASLIIGRTQEKVHLYLYTYITVVTLPFLYRYMPGPLLSSLGTAPITTLVILLVLTPFIYSQHLSI